MNPLPPNSSEPARRVLFRPKEYRELTGDDQEFLATAYEQALAAVKLNITPKGFSACSLEHNEYAGSDENYRSVWARDGAITAIWTLDLDDEEIRAAQVSTFDTLMSKQAPNGQIPANVRIETGEPEYMGVGGIASIDSVMWIIIGIAAYARETDDWSIVDRHFEGLKLAMAWLGAHDSNNCGLLEIPEASDWADLFGFSYHVLYDEVLWYRSLVCFADILERRGEVELAKERRTQAEGVSKLLVKKFWPSTSMEGGSKDGDSEQRFSFTDAQNSLGDARYLMAQISPFSFSWRCDVYGNILAYLTGLLDKERALMTFRFLWGVGANEPGLVKNLYPPVQAGDPEWRSYYTVNLLNLPNHYHNGGIWPFVGGMWVRYIYKLGMEGLARRELLRLAELCSGGVSHKWEFNEWHHGQTARPMGKAFQAWSAASFIRACHDLHVDPASIS